MRKQGKPTKRDLLLSGNESPGTLPETHLIGVPLFSRGIARDSYDLGDRLLFVETDRVTAFRIRLPNPIPEKGRILARLARFWLGRATGIVPQHSLLDESPEDVIRDPEALRRWRGRSLVVRKVEPLLIRAAVHGYLTRTAWKEYTRSGSLGGVPLPPGLRICERLPRPIFVPCKKNVGEERGKPLTFRQAMELAGEEALLRVGALSLRLFSDASAWAESKGLLLAQAEFRFGWFDGTLFLIDLPLTPDTAQYWDPQVYAPGRPQPDFEKLHLASHLNFVSWDCRTPAPVLPPEVVRLTSLRYIESFERLTGEAWQDSSYYKA